MQVTLLGTGTSTGVPVLGCSCPTCTSENPKNKRLRCACHISIGTLSIIVDTGPDFRQQAFRANLKTVDAVLFTHSHFDHVVGMDDLRPFGFYNENPIPCYTSSHTAKYLRQMFYYIFLEGNYPGVPKLVLEEVSQPFEIKGRYPENNQETILIEPLSVWHGKLPILGFRIGNFAYLTDTSHIPEATFEQLQGLEVLVLDALREEVHPTHFSLMEAIEVAQRINAKQTFFTHMAHNIDFETVEPKLPSGINLGYDGLSFICAYT